MPANKDRLYVAVFTKIGAENMPSGLSFHWGYIVSHKGQTRLYNYIHAHRMYHATNETLDIGYPLPSETACPWWYEACDLRMERPMKVYLRLEVGKILNLKGLEELFAKIPLRPESEGWNSKK
ncbi:hypothetical protein VHEMI09131 [[Torrubiella] hemipterigena]|uniref:Uncharacterized protein n=1 Tax=[Torrubiella] hemipterigena TaxID=1531966 RepID=A0A0A1T8V1_9HYPO|nr:hypothetical protein VHEMI09131 [[Torrubiella] hemipterigena]